MRACFLAPPCWIAVLLLAFGLTAPNPARAAGSRPAQTCTISGAESVCANTANLVFDVTSPDAGATFEWVVSGNGTIAGATNQSTVTVTSGSPGSFTLVVTVTAGSGSGTCSRTVVVLPTPTCNISGPESVCPDTPELTFTASSPDPAAGFVWAVSGNAEIVGSTTGSSVTVRSGAVGTFSLMVTVTSAGCSATCTRTVVVSGVPACTIEGPEGACPSGENLTFSVADPGGGATFQWVVTGSAEISGPNTGSSVQLRAGASGTFTVAVTVTSGGCVSTCSRTVVIGSNTCTIGGPQIVCPDSSGILFVVTEPPPDQGGPEPGPTYAWSVTGDATITSRTDTSFVEVRSGASGSFTVSVVVTSVGCTRTCSATATISADCPGGPGPGPSVDCFLTGGGTLAGGDAGGGSASFGGNVGPGSRGNWNHQQQGGGRPLHFQSDEVHVVRCFDDGGDGPCHPDAPANVVEFAGSGSYTNGNGGPSRDATFVARAEDRGEPGNVGHGQGGCGSPDFYSITIRNADDGSIALEISGSLEGGNLQIHDARGRGGRDSTRLAPPRPNPFRRETRLEYRVPAGEAANVEVGVYDVAGRLIRTLVREVRSPGSHEARWDGRDEHGQAARQGLYFMRCRIAGVDRSTRVLFVH